MNFDSSTICAISTAAGVGAIAVIRVSGEKAFPVVGQLFKREAQFMDAKPNQAKYGEIYAENRLIDQVIFVKFFAPHSYTGEDMVEISCHGSLYVQKKIVELLLQCGCRLAEPGEFTMRAFMNKKMDLLQAEAVSDLIESQSEAAHKLAVNQLKGGFSKKIETLRQEFIQLAALLELELDFSEEEVEFADRTQLKELLSRLKQEIAILMESFKMGNAIKTGIPVAIIGKPNVGKSTLLNALLNDDRAIVSHIPGTTRDTIEDTFMIHGTTFRFIDTAGIRSSHDEIEKHGIQRTFQTIEKADIILYLIDITNTAAHDVEKELEYIKQSVDIRHKKLILIANKIDQLTETPRHFREWSALQTIYISAKRKVNIEEITDLLAQYVREQRVGDHTLLTNVRHYNIMTQIAQDIENIEQGMTAQLPTDLLAIDVRTILNRLGEITGAISNDDILNTIFGQFCIGK